MFNVTEYIKKNYWLPYQADFSGYDLVCHGYDFVMNFSPYYEGEIPSKHKLDNGYLTYTYYCPGDSRMVLYDFSYLQKDGIVIVLDGSVQYPIGHREEIERLNIEEFLRRHGYKMMVSTSHYKVSWGIFGKWDN